MFSYEHRIGFVEAGQDKKLHLVNAMNLLMNCCQFQEYQEVSLSNYLHNHDLLIFLHSIQVDIHRLPEFREKVTTAVKIYGCRSIYGLRTITMRDEAGKLCLTANATGAFFSIAEHKAIKLDPDELGVKFDEPDAMEMLPRKIPIPRTQGITLREHVVSRSQLDPNGHLTSPEYLALAEDCLLDDFKFNRFRIEFKQQAKLGDIITPVMYVSEENPDTRVIDLKGSNERSCAVVEFSTFGGK